MMTTIPGPFEGRYYLLGEQGVGGRCVEFFLKNLVYDDDEMNTGPKPEDAYERFNRNAARVPAGSGGVIFLPWLNGSIAPQEAQHARGGFMNLSLTTTRDHLCRAIMEGLAYNSRWTLGPAEKLMGVKVRHIRFSGGGAQSDLWAQIHADVLGLPILQIDDPVTTTVRGTAMLAFHTLGYLSSDELVKCTQTKCVYEPDGANKDVYDKMYTQYCRLFKRNLKIFKSLNR
jgi:xylulokinase